MAGVFVLITPADMPTGAAIAHHLAELMTLFPWQRARLVEAEPGRVWLGAVVNSGDDSALDAASHRAGSLMAVVEGWFLRSRTECGAEAPISAQRHAEAAVAAYRHSGSGFAAALEGQFNAILYDAMARTVLIGNSRHEHSPLHIRAQDGIFAAATILGPLGACGLFSPVVEPRAVATFLAYGQLFADQSLLEGVRVMDQACVLEIAVESARVRATRYWDMGCIAPAPEAMSMQGHVAELASVLRVAGRLAVRRPGRYVVGLSGGLDSRLNLAAVRPHLPDLKAWTFGRPGAFDLRISGTITRLMGIEHLTYLLDPAATSRNVSDFVSTVDGCMTDAFAYQLDRARDLRDKADIVLNGYAGEVILRGVMLDLSEKHWLHWARGRLKVGPRAPHPRFEQNTDLDGALLFLKKKYGRLSGLADLTRPAPPSFTELACSELERLRASVAGYLLADAWVLENRGRRWTMMGIVSDRHFYDDGSVFYDYDFQDRCFATPVRHRRWGRLYAPLLRSLNPVLAALPSGNTGLPIDAPRARIIAGRLASRLGYRGVGSAPRLSTGAMPAVSSRSVLRDYYQNLVDDSRTRGRSWWDAGAIADRWRSHLAREIDFSAEMGLMAAVEHFARRWVDGVRS